MAARKPRTPASDLFALAERQIVALYDAGVLSPAVLHHVLAAYANTGIDWKTSGRIRTVDDRSMQEAIVLVMMPGRASRAIQKDFLSIVEHVASGDAPSSNERSEPGDQGDQSDDEEDEALLSQLSGGKRRSGSAKEHPQTHAKKSAGFNPLVGARAVPKR
jgi:hypothetical protein